MRRRHKTGSLAGRRDNQGSAHSTGLTEYFRPAFPQPPTVFHVAAGRVGGNSTRTQQPQDSHLDKQSLRRDPSTARLVNIDSRSIVRAKPASGGRQCLADGSPSQRPRCQRPASPVFRGGILWQGCSCSCISLCEARKGAKWPKTVPQKELHASFLLRRQEGVLFALLLSSRLFSKCETGGRHSLSTMSPFAPSRANRAGCRVAWPLSFSGFLFLLSQTGWDDDDDGWAGSLFAGQSRRVARLGITPIHDEAPILSRQIQKPSTVMPSRRRKGGRLSRRFYSSSPNHSANAKHHTGRLRNGGPPIPRPGTQCIHAPSCDGRRETQSTQPGSRWSQIWPTPTCAAAVRPGQQSSVSLAKFGFDDVARRHSGISRPHTQSHPRTTIVSPRFLSLRPKRQRCHLGGTTAPRLGHLGRG